MFFFEWDDDKAQRNLEKHGVSFEEAQTVFNDGLAGIRTDPDHSIGEEREIIVGRSERDRLVLVSFTQRAEMIRIINARFPTRNERRIYEEES